jgi:hypothetical protein
MYRQTIEIEIEIDDEKMAAAIGQAANVMGQSLLPETVRQVFFELPESSQITLQLPQLALQKLENNHGQVQGQSNPRLHQ